ncbi:MAG: chorismate mutase [Acidobacteriota bacterium]
MNRDIRRDLRPWRDRIDAIDQQLAELLNERAACAIEIGKLKRTAALPIYDPARETEILRRISAHDGGPLSGAALRRVFERILDESRSQERAGAPASDTDTDRRQ